MPASTKITKGNNGDKRSKQAGSQASPGGVTDNYQPRLPCALSQKIGCQKGKPKQKLEPMHPSGGQHLN
jgi:hypothetical protein